MNEKLYRIKPLVWSDAPDESLAESDDEDVYVVHVFAGRWGVYYNGYNLSGQTYYSREAAKDAAESLYILRVSQCLEEVK